MKRKEMEENVMRGDERGKCYEKWGGKRKKCKERWRKKEENVMKVEEIKENI